MERNLLHCPPHCEVREEVYHIMIHLRSYLGSVSQYDTPLSEHLSSQKSALKKRTSPEPLLLHHAHVSGGSASAQANEQMPLGEKR